MNEKFEKLFELFKSATLDLVIDVALDNHWQRRWKPDIQQKFENMQNKGEFLAKKVPEDSKIDNELNKILNDMDDLWREAKGKGLI